MAQTALTAADLTYTNLITSNQHLSIGARYLTITRVEVVPAVGEREAYEKPILLSAEKLMPTADAIIDYCFPITQLQEKSDKKAWTIVINKKQELFVYTILTAKAGLEEAEKAKAEKLKEYYFYVLTIGR